MVAIQMQEGAVFDSSGFYAFAKSRLPRYALPQFVRISQSLDMTGTYKLRKVDLQRQSYAQSQVSDPLWVIQENQSTYAPLTPESLAQASYPRHPLDQ